MGHFLASAVRGKTHIGVTCDPGLQESLSPPLQYSHFWNADEGVLNQGLLHNSVFRDIPKKHYRETLDGQSVSEIWLGYWLTSSLVAKNAMASLRSTVGSGACFRSHLRWLVHCFPLFLQIFLGITVLGSKTMGQILTCNGIALVSMELHWIYTSTNKAQSSWVRLEPGSVTSQCQRIVPGDKIW